MALPRQEFYKQPPGNGGGGGATALAALDFGSAAFSDPSGLLTSWNQTSVGAVSVVYDGSLASTTPGFRPGASWTWALSDLDSDFVAESSFVLAEIFTTNWPKTSTGAQVGIAVTDNGTVALASGSGVEHYDSGVNDERCRAYFATGANGNTGRAGMDYMHISVSPRYGSAGFGANCSGHATAGNFFQEYIATTSGALSHLVVSVGQELALVTGTFDFRAAAAVFPGTGLEST